uniref:Rab GDP dissociation inhibitor n=2 Tax=Phaeomonas parva TaxID=124430 RepID=A0A7S1XT43_9STRA|mmetsp:Transcript_31844/g.101312  ORF Transcript_31844/g.101312 Transcript_31844/m.101312 type:complete len:367 (+) Transcript_31844:243-1343(+)
MACGALVKILVHTRVEPYLQFKQISGSFVVKDGKVQKVPSTPQEAIASSLMGMFEKRRFRTFIIYVAQYKEDDPSTWEGKDVMNMPMGALFDAFNLDANTQSFVGHAMALHRDDGYLQRPAIETVRALQLYTSSIEQYGRSPYLYPVWGLGGLPESFSRLCAVNGGTFMLNCDVQEVMTNADGVAWGIKAKFEDKVCAAKARLCVVGDPSYFPAEKVRPTGRVARSICILDHPIRGVSGDSGQIIVPMREARRNHDIYIAFLGNEHEVAPKNRFIAIVSTTVETADPMAELEPGIRLLGNVMERFDAVVETFEPVGSGEDDRMFISRSYDATSHFETVADDVRDMFRRVTGEVLDLSSVGGAENVA